LIFGDDIIRALIELQLILGKRIEEKGGRSFVQARRERIKKAPEEYHPEALIPAMDS
jgi:hypothetical protein